MRISTRKGLAAVVADRGAGPPAPLGAARRRDVHFALESAAPTVILEGEMRVLTKKRADLAPGPPARRLKRA